MSFPRVRSGEGPRAVLQRRAVFLREDYPSDRNNLGTRAHVRTRGTME